MIATTISNSINEKPFCFRISFSLSSDFIWSQWTKHWLYGTSSARPESHRPGPRFGP
jgi:hypothetical protein